MHLIQKTGSDAKHQLRWTREEGLSSIKQLEVLHEAAGNQQMAHSFEYVKHWKAVGGSPLTRIVQRYNENANYFFRYLFSTAQISPDARSKTDVYGFTKSLIALTNYGKITSFSSRDGSVEWNSEFTQEQPVQVLLRTHYLRAEETTETQVVSCFSNKLVFLSSHTGEAIYTQPLNITANKFIVTNLKGETNQVVLAIGQDQSGDTKVEVYPKEDFPDYSSRSDYAEWMANQHIHFTEIEKSSGILKGYKVIDNWATVQHW